MDGDESIIKKAHPHPASFLGFYFAGIILILIGFASSFYFILGGFGIFILSELVRRAETFYVLKGGVERKYHFLSTSKKFVEYNNIQNLEVYQSIMQRVLGIGSVHMDSAGGDAIEINFHGVKDPYSIERAIRAEMVSK